MKLIAGIDEAGRGPVIGPLVVALAVCKRSYEKKLKELCKRDSKKLSPKKREEILRELEEFCEFYRIIITAKEINKKMKEKSLNDIEAEAMAKLIKGLKKRLDLIIDLPDRYSWVFRKRMEKYGIKKFEAEHRADEKYPIVAAASIYAKVRRDKEIEKIKKIVGFDFGSGYPGDRKTRECLKNKMMLQKLKPYIRERWKTLENLKQKKLTDLFSS